MKIRGTIRGQTILLDTLPGFGMDQRVEVDITPVEDVTETVKARKDEADTPESNQNRKRVTTLSDILSRMGISREELDARIATEPQFESIRRADKLREKREKLRGGKLNLTTQWIREDRDR